MDINRICCYFACILHGDFNKKLDQTDMLNIRLDLSADKNSCKK